MVDLAGGHQAEQCPSRLRGGARSLLITAIIELVARAVFAPAAILVLNTREPVDRLADFRGTMVDAGSVKRDQHRPGAVDVVHAPAPVPASFRVLGPSQIIEGLGDARILA